jgi:hypothetical protein
VVLTVGVLHGVDDGEGVVDIVEGAVYAWFSVLLLELLSCVSTKR